MKNIKLKHLTSIIFVIIIGSLIWWNTPCSITNIAPSEVSEIGIFNGNTGKSISITDATDIEHIIKNLNTIFLKREKISLGYMGYTYKTTIYKINGDVYKEFIINSNDFIRKDPFFYRVSSGIIDYEFINEIMLNSERDEKDYDQ
ncbi:MAG: hypothetical protein U9Q80_09305 [Bacillota bacterium]|nr:hypothetical protein [Bacillota bacterium]